MVTIMMLALAFTAQNSAERQVRAVEPRILALIDAGLSRSETFRQLVATLNDSDVVVYIDPKRSHQALGGYMAHTVTVAGRFRYLHIAIDITGAEGRLIPLLAHELQHAVEIARSPDPRDAAGVREAFLRRAQAFGCTETDCYETRAAVDVEHIVSDELKASTQVAAR
jgi:hypothetical protein